MQALSSAETKKILDELENLEAYFEAGVERCHRLREQLERVSAPGPKGDKVETVDKETKRLIAERVEKRNKRLGLKS